MEVFYGHDLDGMLDAGAYVFDFQIRVIIAADRIKRNPIPYKFEHVLHGDSCAGDTRLSEMYIVVDCDSIFHGTHLRISQQIYNNTIILQAVHQYTTKIFTGSRASVSILAALASGCLLAQHAMEESK
jgi:hypothetical protein